MSRPDGHPYRITRIVGTLLYLADLPHPNPLPKGEGDDKRCNQGRSPPSLLNLPRLPSLDEQNYWRSKKAFANRGDVSERNTKTVIIVDVIIPVTNGRPQRTRGIVERSTSFG